MRSSQLSSPSANSLADYTRRLPLAHLPNLDTTTNQVILITPATSIRPRKTKKKRQPDRTERNSNSEEPRFTTSVKPAVLRRVPATPTSPVRGRKAAPATQARRVADPLLDVLDTAVPDYPPPSFQEAISSALPYDPSSTADDGASTSILSPGTSAPSSPATFPVHSMELVTHELSTFGQVTAEPPRVQEVPSISRDSAESGSDISSIEMINFERPQLWEADRNRGLNLQERVALELVRQQAAESTAALTTFSSPRSSSPASSPPPTPTSRERHCSHCGSVRPLEQPNVQTPEGNDDDRGNSWIRGGTKGRRQGSMAAHLRALHDASSAPTSPSSVSPTSMTSSSNPWASNLTLTLSSVFMSHRPPAETSNLKRKESFGVRRLFSKAKEPECSPEQPTADGLDSWEVIDVTSPTSAESLPAEDWSIKNARSSARQKPSQQPLAFISRPLRKQGRGAVSPFPVASTHAPPTLPPEKSRGGPHAPAPTANPPQPPRYGLPPQASERAPGTIPTLSSVRIMPLGVNDQNIQSPIGPPSVLHAPFSSEKRMSDPMSRHVPVSPAHRTPLKKSSLPLLNTMKPKASSPVSPVDFPPLPGRNALGASGMPEYSTLANDSPAHERAPATVSLEPTVQSQPPTPATPMSAGHYPGRPLPQPPSSPLNELPLVTPQSVIPRKAGLHVVEPHAPQSSQIAATQRRERTYSDALMSRTRSNEQPANGRPREELLVISETVYPAIPDPLNADAAAPPKNHPFVGKVELQRRRPLKDGRSNTKLTLLGVIVDKCGICIREFKEEDMAALGPVCQHCFHERCLRRWLALNRTCPLCRVALSLDDNAFSRI
ncbi:uncharacterized protein LAESUDRAFT_725282 [Laetiporus sulphureus 93-53]|uniref:RING-type domain-containing protein n=1 Tax=Laetiporus sulphureus 93-53 TaxID=1314785 RepID=A0A165EFS2_9APHY|nr:uncharacterized protein LAESUDRAFT_725282 [Laetiporus sulphureus 93-53]KZT06968.1 hypothetical protein LAESUDRAFT_725282 [Laetiporus sulphureus 93-53]